jgi:WXG100 family type VII secretion target
VTAYDVDLGELRTAIAELAACQRDLLALGSDIGLAQADLQAGWAGRAADAQVTSYDSWRDGCAEMVTSLASLRGIVARADDHYSAAADANVALWRRVSA